MLGPDEPHPYTTRSFTYRTEASQGKRGTKGDRVHTGSSNTVAGFSSFLFITLISREIILKYASQSQQMFKITLWSSLH
jgi:hypothetical protein